MSRAVHDLCVSAAPATIVPAGTVGCVSAVPATTVSLCVWPFVVFVALERVYWIRRMTIWTISSRSTHCPELQHSYQIG